MAENSVLAGSCKPQAAFGDTYSAFTCKKTTCLNRERRVRDGLTFQKKKPVQIES